MTRLILGISFVAFFLTLFSQCADRNASPVEQEKTPPTYLRVGVYDGHGGAQTCVWEAYEAARIDTGVRVRYVRTSDIARGILDSLDVIIVPGGGGSRQFLNMGAGNRERLKAFIHQGGGYVGICAGAYLASNTPDYACLGISGAKAIDIEHDNRGHGVVKFTLTEAGRALFPELADYDTCYLSYYEGPVYDTIGDAQYVTFATMESDVHTEGNAPSNMTNGRPFYIGSQYGKGRVFSCIAHPEGTPGMRWMIPRMVRWVAGVDNIPYASQGVVRPEQLKEEVLFTLERNRREGQCYSDLLYGDAQTKCNALDWLERHTSWDAKRWVQGMVYDASPAVRRRAAEYMARSGFTHYIPDLQQALALEQDSTARKTLSGALRTLEQMIGKRSK